MAPPSFRQANQIMQMRKASVPTGAATLASLFSGASDENKKILRRMRPTEPHLAGTPSPESMPGLLIPGNITNLYNRIPLQRPEGPPWYGDVSTATTRGVGFDDSGREIVIPTVVDGVDLGDEGAWARFEETGKHFGMFDTHENAQAYTEQLHDRMNRRQGPEASWLMRLLRGSPRPGPDR